MEVNGSHMLRAPEEGTWQVQMASDLACKDGTQTNNDDEQAREFANIRGKESNAQGVNDGYDGHNHDPPKIDDGNATLMGSPHLNYSISQTYHARVKVSYMLQILFLSPV
jgi:hypothetical protein